MFLAKVGKLNVHEDALLEAAACTLGLSKVHTRSDVPFLLQKAGLSKAHGLSGVFMEEVERQVSLLKHDAQYYLPMDFPAELPRQLRDTPTRQSPEFGVAAEIRDKIETGSATTYLNDGKTAAAWHYSDFGNGPRPKSSLKYEYEWLCTVSFLEAPFFEVLANIRTAFETGPISATASLLMRSHGAEVGAASLVARSRSDAAFFWADYKIPGRYGNDEWLLRLHVCARAGGDETAIWGWALRKLGTDGI